MKGEDFAGRSLTEARGYYEALGKVVSVRIVTPEKQKKYDKVLVTGVKDKGEEVIITACGFLAAPEEPCAAQP